MNFETSGNDFLSFFKKIHLKKSVQNKIKVGVAIMPWMKTAVPWFSLLLAIKYYIKGYDVKIIFHDTGFSKDEKKDCEIIEQVLKKIFIFDILKLSKEKKSKLNLQEKINLRKKINENSIYFSNKTKYHTTLIRNVKLILYESSSKLKSTLTKFSFDHLIVPGGIYGHSSLYFALQIPARVATYDSGFFTVLASPQGIAAQLNDTLRAIQISKKIIQKNIKLICNLARIELKKRANVFSRETFSKKNRPDVVIPLNIFDDSAAINQIQNFQGPKCWLSETLRFLIKQKCKTFVREHPIANKICTNRKIFFECKSKFMKSKYVRFISAEQPGSIYEFYKHCRLVLPVSSTAGIEAACYGKPIVVESAAYYRSASFAYAVSSKTKYFKKIKDLLKIPQNLTAEVKQEALIWYFMQKISCAATRITPDPADFVKWSKSPPSEVFQDSALNSVFESISQNLPFAYCRLNSLLGLGNCLRRIVCYIKLRYCSAF